MRILGEIAHPAYKITVFKHDQRVLLKIEHGLLEQTYKFRESDDINKIEHVSPLLTEAFLESVTDTFRTMHGAISESLTRYFQEQDEEFPTII